MVFTRVKSSLQATGGVDTLIDDTNTDPTHYNLKFTPEVFYPGDKFRYLIEEYYEDLAEYRGYEYNEVTYSDLKPTDLEIDKPKDYLKNLVARLKLDGDLTDSSGNSNNGSIAYSSNFVSWWKFEDDLTDTIGTQDLSVGGGSAAYVDTPFGRGLDFSSDYFTASDSPYDIERTDAFSCEFWVKLDSVTDEYIFDKRSTTEGFGLLINAGKVDFFMVDTGGTSIEYKSTTSLSTATWYHIVIAKDTSNTTGGVNIYINGVAETVVEVGSFPTATTQNAATLRIGSRFNNTQYLDGILTHFRFYTSELSATQVTELYRKNTKTNFDNGIGTEAFHPIGHESFTFATESNFDLDKDKKQSYSFWSNAPATTAGVIYAKNNGDATTGTQIEFTSAGKLRVRLINTATTNEIDVISNSALTDGQWHHYIVIYAGGSSASDITLYQDGASVADTDTTNNLSSSILNNNTPTVGSHSNSTVFLTGQIQDFRVADVLYTSGQASQIYNATKAYYDPILYMKFEDNANDSSSEANNGTWSGTELYDLGQVGEKSARFDGASQVDITNSNGSKYRFHKNQPFSVSYWGYEDSAGVGFPAIITKSNSATTTGMYIAQAETTQRVDFILHDGTTLYQTSSTTDSVPNNEWHHVVCTFDGSANRSGMKIYIDGVLDTTGTSSAMSLEIINILDLAVGAQSDGGSRLTGNIDELKIWNYELTADEVLKEAGRKIGSIYLPITQGLRYRMKLQDLSPSPRKYYWERNEIQ